MIRIAVAALFVLHSLIHLLGFAKAFGFADLPRLSQPVSPPSVCCGLSRRCCASPRPPGCSWPRPDSPWMTFTADQLNIVDTPRRYFAMTARMKGLPVDALHAFDENGASMRVRLLSVRSTRMRWTTPLAGHARVGPARLSTRGEARWHPDSGAWTYGEFTLTSLVYDAAPRRPALGRPAPSAVVGAS